MTWVRADKRKAERHARAARKREPDVPPEVARWREMSDQALGGSNYNKREEGMQLTDFEATVKALGAWSDRFDAERRGWGAQNIIERHDAVTAKLPKAMWTVSEALAASDDQIRAMYAVEIENIIRFLYGPSKMPGAEMEAVGMAQRDPDLDHNNLPPTAKRFVTDLANARYDAEIEGMVAKGKHVLNRDDVRKAFLASDLGRALEAITLDPGAAGVTREQYAIRLTKRLLRDDVKMSEARQLQYMLKVVGRLA